MNSGTKWIYAVMVFGLLIWGCGKDKKTTGPEDTGPNASGTLGEVALIFHEFGGNYFQTSGSMMLAFSQNGEDTHPIALIILEAADQVQVGNAVSCEVLLSMDAGDNYFCGNNPENDSAAATIIFSGLELTGGGLLSGRIEGLVEHRNHPQEDLLPLNIVFSNIPVKLYW